MAFGNYSYNPYVNPYMIPYQPQQMTTPQIPQMQPTQMSGANQNGGFVWVDGIEEAKSFFVAPNNAVQLWDKNAPTIYKKSADSTGKPTMQIFDLVERKTEPPAAIEVKNDFSGYVKRDEIERIEARIAALEAINAAGTEKGSELDE